MINNFLQGSFKKEIHGHVNKSLLKSQFNLDFTGIVYIISSVNLKLFLKAEAVGLTTSTFNIVDTNQIILVTKSNDMCFYAVIANEVQNTLASEIN